MGAAVIFKGMYKTFVVAALLSISNSIYPSTPLRVATGSGIAVSLGLCVKCTQAYRAMKKAKTKYESTRSFVDQSTFQKASQRFTALRTSLIGMVGITGFLALWTLTHNAEPTTSTSDLVTDDKETATRTPNPAPRPEKQEGDTPSVGTPITQPRTEDAPLSQQERALPNHALLAAINRYSLTQMDEAIKLGAKPNFLFPIGDGKKSTYLIEAIKQGFAGRSAIQKLITYGANVNAITPDGQTAIAAAVHSGIPALVNELLPHVEITDNGAALLQKVEKEKSTAPKHEQSKLATIAKLIRTELQKRGITPAEPHPITSPTIPAERTTYATELEAFKTHGYSGEVTGYDDEADRAIFSDPFETLFDKSDPRITDIRDPSILDKVAAITNLDSTIGTDPVLFRVPAHGLQQVAGDGYCFYRAVTGELGLADGRENATRLVKLCKKNDAIGDEDNLDPAYQIDLIDDYDQLCAVVDRPIIVLVPAGHTETSLVFQCLTVTHPANPTGDPAPIVLLARDTHGSHYERYRR
ncbi:MAG: hypothetical protein QG604_337 [Candidatus Dependentiae bacterium]|nr:hypothetical protein [Candidatus Dependentiae bacterium]